MNRDTSIPERLFKVFCCRPFGLYTSLGTAWAQWPTLPYRRSWNVVSCSIFWGAIRLLTDPSSVCLHATVKDQFHANCFNWYHCWLRSPAAVPWGSLLGPSGWQTPAIIWKKRATSEMCLRRNSRLSSTDQRVLRGPPWEERIPFR